jgi:ribosomal-protein-alanine N-acetyltransferase
MTAVKHAEALRVHVRWMIRRDFAEVLAIEAASFEYAWDEADFLQELRKRSVIGMVAEVGERVVGFIVYELHKSRVHIVNLATHPECRRLAVGRQLVAKVQGKLASHWRNAAFAVVRESNLDAQLFLKAMGFHCFDVLRGYYEDSGDDGYVMRYRLGGRQVE